MPMDAQDYERWREERDRKELESIVEWPPPGGPFEQWIAHELDCLVLRAPLGNLNGYVKVPPNHPDAARPYHDLENHVDVHGGLTFGCRVKDGRWFGFDTAHAGDAVPQLTSMRDIYGLPQGFLRLQEHTWTLADVKAETEHLAEQLAKRWGNPS